MAIGMTRAADLHFFGAHTVDFGGNIRIRGKRKVPQAYVSGLPRRAGS